MPPTAYLLSHQKGQNELPGTIPSSTAALVAFNASVTLSFLSPTSDSLAPPTCRCLVPSSMWGHEYKLNITNWCHLGWRTNFENSNTTREFWKSFLCFFFIKRRRTLVHSCPKLQIDICLFNIRKVPKKSLYWLNYLCPYKPHGGNLNWVRLNCLWSVNF